MSENLSVAPDAIVDSLSFQIGDQGFRVSGELTDGRYTGEIGLPDGRSFTGIVERRADGGWKVENWNSGESYESPAETIAEAAPAESQAADLVVSLDSATALASADAAVPVEPHQIDVEIPATPVAEAALPEVVAVNIPEAVAVERTSTENHHASIAELKQKMQEVYKPLRAARLWKQAEGIQAQITTGKDGVKVKKGLMAKMHELRDKARELQPGIEKMGQAPRLELLKKSTPLSAEGPAEAIKMANLRHREDMAAQYEQELDKWEAVLNNPADFEAYRTKAAEIESKRVAAKTLYSDEGDSKLLAQALSMVDRRGNGQLLELRNRLPLRLLELAGYVRSEPLVSPTMKMLNQAESDVDLRLAYNSAAQQLYAELMGEPQAPALPEIPMTEPVLPSEEIPAPVVEVTSEQVVETPLVEAAATPQPVVESVGPETSVPEAATQGAPLAEFDPNSPDWLQANLAAVPPVEASASEVPRGEAIPVEVEQQASVAVPSAAEASTVVPISAEPAAAPVAEAVPPDTLSEPPKPEAVVETSDERLDRRKKGFAQAVAKFDLAKDNRTGAEEERLVQLAESFNEIIGAGIEFMQEGNEAKEVVRDFLEKALNNPSGRKLTEVSVKSRLEDAGALPLLGMTPEDRKKKLEEAGLMGFLELLIELGMSFADKTIEAIVGEVQSATGGKG